MIARMNLTECIFASWSPQIGDPTVMGWVIVAAYGATAALCFLAALRSPVHRETVFWSVLTLCLLALMVNKQLDLQTAVTAFGRCMAQMNGWYQDRRHVQLLFAIGVLVAAVVVAVVLLLTMRHSLRRIWPALLGLVCVMSFVAIRVLSFHHVDEMIGYRLGAFNMKWAFELTGLILIAANVVWLLSRSRNALGPADP
jgi:hypothetical protein